jgi:hypothetical protein
VSADYVQAGLSGEDSNVEVGGKHSRTWLDWGIVAVATAMFIILAFLSRVPGIDLNWTAISLLSAILLVFLVTCGAALWKATHFS